MCCVEQTRLSEWPTLMARFNMLRVSLLTLISVMSFVVPTTAAEPVLSQYRGVTLGDSVQTVIGRLHLVDSDVKVVHERPTVVQEVTWRPHRFVSGTTVE